MTLHLFRLAAARVLLCPTVRPGVSTKRSSTLSSRLASCGPRNVSARSSDLQGQGYRLPWPVGHLSPLRRSSPTFSIAPLLVLKPLPPPPPRPSRPVHDSRSDAPGPVPAAGGREGAPAASAYRSAPQVSSGRRAVAASRGGASGQPGTGPGSATRTGRTAEDPVV